jgi:hypothetical protein
LFNLKIVFREILQEKLQQGDKRTIYNILAWLLEGFPKHEKRVYLARYLLPIVIPDEILNQDDHLVELNDEYKQSMDQFKEVHRAHQTATRELQDPGPLEETLNALEDEIEVVNQQIEEMTQKIISLVCICFCD